jgi:alpha-mannosidase
MEKVFMFRNFKKWALLPLTGALVLTCAWGQAAKPAAAKAAPTAKSKYAAPDLTKQHTLYVIPYAHLDTEWRWDYPTTIKEYLPATMRDNFALFKKYPHYIFNFSGANRYRMMKEYYPADYQQVKYWVAAGRWFPAGSAMEESDVNSPNAESIIRQILYGTHLFRSEFGKTSAEYMLPDCFGFPASLPSILAHSGIKGFSTQKLSWHSGANAGGPGSPQDTPAGIPFNVGYWQGLDGKGVIAALNATSYSGDVTEDLTKSPTWIKRVQKNGESMGLFTDFRYYGTGDVGGAPRERSVSLMESILTKGEAVLPPQEHRGRDYYEQEPTGPAVKVGDGPLTVLQTTAEQMFLDIPAKDIARMPKYQGDLELTEHSAGSLTSEAYMKRWNRENEVLADEAERASVAAAWLGGVPYPQQRLNNAWTLVMGGEFHDIIPGTSLPKAYEYAWNDQVLAMNQFAGVLTSATESIASGLNTEVKGTPVVVYNSLNTRREDVVEANVSFPNGQPKAVRVFGADGKEVPSQLENGKVLFLAKMPSVGFSVFDVQPSETAYEPNAAEALKVTDNSLENARYRVTIDENGDVSSIYDKLVGKELLSSPARLALSTDKPSQWPAWNMDWTDQQKPPRDYVGGPAKIRVVENGPVRVAIEVARENEGSSYVQTISLSAGDAGNRVEFGNVIDWRTADANLKATFPLTASNPEATYNWDIGTIQRGNDDPKKFEVGSHQWFDLTDKSGTYGVTVLSGAKYGSDKPNDNTLRLTLLRTPGIAPRAGYSDQASQDWGHHEFMYGLAAHQGDWRNGQTDWQALRLNAPLVAFETTKHQGTLGKDFSLLNVSSDRVRVMAVKKAEDSNEVVVRLVEVDGKPQQNVRIAFAEPIIAAREVNGQEMPVGPATVAKGELVTSFGPYQPRTFAVKLAPAKGKLTAPKSQPVELAYTQSVATPDGRPGLGGFDEAGRALPAEMLPAELSYNGVQFKLGPGGKPNAVIPRGQTINLPAGNFNRVYVIAASADGDRKATFRVGDISKDFTVENWTGYIGQWDNRKWKTVEVPVPPEPAANDQSPAAERARRFRAWVKEHGPVTREEYAGLTPGFVKTAPVAWFASHRHGTDGANQPYDYSYLFVYSMDIPANAKTLTLPNDGNLRILAVSVANESADVQPVHPLYDTLANNAAALEQTPASQQQ